MVSHSVVDVVNVEHDDVQVVVVVSYTDNEVKHTVVEVFITIEVGQEKLRYLGGCARAFIKDEESIIISLDDIYYEVKQKWGIVPNRAES